MNGGTIYNPPTAASVGALTQTQGDARYSLQSDFNALVVLTDSTGGAVDNTVDAVPDPANAPLTPDALRDDIVATTLPAIRNGLAAIAAKVNELRGAGGNN